MPQALLLLLVAGPDPKGATNWPCDGLGIVWACARFAPAPKIAAVAKRDLTRSHEWWRFFCADNRETASNRVTKRQDSFASPFRIPILTFHSGVTDANINAADGTAPKGILDWQLQLTFASWEDGTTNQIIFAEKFIPEWAREDNNNANGWDGGYQMSFPGDYSSANIARIIGNDESLFARGRHDSNRLDSSTYPKPGTDREGNEMLGSSHPGIVNILIGDGSVRAVPISTLPLIMARLACTVDGEVAAIP